MKDKKNTLLAMCIVALCCACTSVQQQETIPQSLAMLRSGDLLFVSDLEGMGSAVQQSTGNYTHVAMVERDGDSLYIIDATPSLGVARRQPGALGCFDIYRLDVPFDTAAVLARAHALLGRSYDDAFLPGNDAYYCSELIYECFLDSAGQHLFEAKPMNWRDAKGRLPRYWRKHFKRLGMSVPEGVDGTNPTDMSRSPLLRQIE